MPLLVAPLVSSAAPLATGRQHALVPGWGGVDDRFGWQLREALIEGWPRRARPGPCDEHELSDVLNTFPINDPSLFTYRSRALLMQLKVDAAVADAERQVSTSASEMT